MRAVLILVFYLFALTNAYGQKHYWVYFKIDPKGNRQQLEKNYIKKIGNRHIKVLGTSKWFEAAYVSVKDERYLKRLENYSFVKRIESGRTYRVKKLATTLDSLNYGQADVQLSMLGLSNYHNKGYTGKGIVIALFDAGFYRVDVLHAFDSLRNRNGILATRDFVSKNKAVYDDDRHGMFVLSLIAGYVKDSMQGAAPDASFILGRTEDVGSEKHIEEFNWVKAMEWADSIGVDIIHSSLGYHYFDSLEGNYSYSDMDGESTIITRAAEKAFEKGIFITNSAGNEGGNTWKHITAPCDGKNVLCVGSVDSFRRKSKFSSFGPSADGRVKPDVMAMGQNITIPDTNNIMRRGSGTSFSGPIIAGFVACLKQEFPLVKNEILLNAIRRSCHLYTNPNDSFGYGIPDIQRADSLVRRQLAYSKALNSPLLKLYPNPVQSILTVETDLEIREIEMVDLTGVRINIFNEKENLDMTHYNAGVYFVKIKTEDNRLFIKKIIKL